MTAAAWSLLHFSETWLTIGLVFLLGLVLGWMLYRFGSLYVTMACHALWNATVALIIFAGLAA